MAITAYTGEFLDELGLNDLEDVARFVPGFEVQNQSPNNPGFVMRGVTSDSGEAFVEPRVSVFQDGVSISKSRGSFVELFDIQRVEIVRGPQSTLYGRGALIGAVNIVQNRADPSGVAAFLEAGYGNFDAWTVEGMLNVPLGDTAAFRVAGRYRNRDGYIENLLGGGDFNSVDTGAIRGTFHWAPSSRVSVDIFANYQEDNPHGTSFKSTSFTPTDPVTGAVLGDRSANSGAALAPGTGFEGGAPLGLDRRVWGVTGIVRAELSDRWTLTSISAYREFDGVEILDADGISLPVITAAADERGEQLSQELRLTYQNDCGHRLCRAFILPRGRHPAHAGPVRRARAARPHCGRAERRRPDPRPAGDRSGADRPVRQHRLHGRSAAGRGRQLRLCAAGAGRAGHRRQSQGQSSRDDDQHVGDRRFRHLRRRHFPSLARIRDRRRRALQPQQQDHDPEFGGAERPFDPRRLHRRAAARPSRPAPRCSARWPCPARRRSRPRPCTRCRSSA